MELKMNNGVLTVIGENKTIEVDIVDGELEVIGDFVVEEEEAEDGEEVIEFEDEPNKPRDAFAHLVDRKEAYPIIEGIKVGDKVRLRLDLDHRLDDIPSIGFKWYYGMVDEMAYRDFEVLKVDKDYSEITDEDEDCLKVCVGDSKILYLSTRWVIKVEEPEKEETYL